MLNLFFFKFLHIPWRILNLDFFFKVFHSIHYYITEKSSSTPDRYLLFSMNKIFLFTARSCKKKKPIQTVHTVIRSMFYFIVISLTRRRKRKRFGDSVVFSDNYKYLNYKYTILLQTQTLTLISISTFATMFEVSLRFLERL